MSKKIGSHGTSQIYRDPVWNFLSHPVHRQTEKQTYKHKDQKHNLLQLSCWTLPQHRGPSICRWQL